MLRELSRAFYPPLRQISAEEFDQNESDTSLAYDLVVADSLARLSDDVPGTRTPTRALGGS